MTMSHLSGYLWIPEEYADWLGGLRWSANGEAIETSRGTTFAFSGEIALFLEGFTARRSLVHFAFVLHMVSLLSRSDPLGSRRGEGMDSNGNKLYRYAHIIANAFQAERRPLRNAGALCGLLCEQAEIPPTAELVDVRDLCQRLSSGPLLASMLLNRWSITTEQLTVEVPPFEPEEFETRFLNALRSLSAGEVRHWMRTGRGPIGEGGEALAREVVARKPASLEGVLASLAQRPRLAGAVPLVEQLVGALDLPPRRLAHRELPTGGYTDVTTRGLPEQVLPSQFALDDLEFLRRFAEHELLYFHREEPHRPVTEALVLVLDQGVRTWGDPRLVLSASTLALGQIAARRGLPLHLAATSRPGQVLDLQDADEAAPGELVEASDLTPHPAPALEAVLAESEDSARDIVLLTHPRSLAEPAVAASARRAGPKTRVFAVAVDGTGQVEFAQLKQGVPVSLARFRVQVRAPSPPPPAAAAVKAAPDTWRGDVEPIGFPFRFGLLSHLDKARFDFDHDGQRLMVASGPGLLHVWELAPPQRGEILPRGMLDGEVLSEVEAVLGVAGGFVVAGRIGQTLVAVHYDFTSRTCAARRLGLTWDRSWDWLYVREAHCVVARGRDLSRALDLATRQCYSSRGSRQRPPPRVVQAFVRASDGFLRGAEPSVMHDPGHDALPATWIALDRKTGALDLRGLHPSWPAFTPLDDGQPVLKGQWIDQAQCRGGVLAVSISGPLKRPHLRLFRVPEGMPLGEFRVVTGHEPFRLSADGRLLARRVGGERQVEVRDTAGGGPSVLLTPKGKCHHDLEVILGPSWMVVQVGKYRNLLRWDRGRLELNASVGNGDLWRLIRKLAGAYDDQGVSAMATGRSLRPSCVRYDPDRFVKSARAGLVAVVDVYGQIVLFDRRGVLVGMVFVFRGQVALWMPDGTRYGPVALTGGPASPDALEKFGAALRAASELTEVIP